jgi:hypothetical protein
MIFPASFWSIVRVFDIVIKKLAELNKIITGSKISMIFLRTPSPCFPLKFFPISFSRLSLLSLLTYAPDIL